MSPRRAEIKRKTLETDINVVLELDGTGRSKVETGIGFLDHLISTLARHARFDLELTCNGDLSVDDHHTAEDCALALGAALDQCLAEREGIGRFGWAYAPLDEALARAVTDLSGRPHAATDFQLEREAISELSCENIPHFIRSLATAARAAIHVDVIRGANDHHKAEAAFKALALSLRQAVAPTAGSGVPSTKGVL